MAIVYGSPFEESQVTKQQWNNPTERAILLKMCDFLAEDIITVYKYAIIDKICSRPLSIKRLQEFESAGSFGTATSENFEDRRPAYASSNPAVGIICVLE